MDNISVHKQEKAPLYLGTVLCQFCNDIIDVLDTDKATILYSVCNRKGCTERRDQD